MIKYSWCVIQFRYTFYCFHLACWHRWIDNIEIAKNILKPFQLIKSKTYALVMNRLFGWMWLYIWAIFPCVAYSSICLDYDQEKWHMKCILVGPRTIASFSCIYNMGGIQVTPLQSCLAYSLVTNWIEPVKFVYGLYANLHL